MRVMRPLILLVGLLAGTAQASERQIWACRTDNAHARPILHLVEWGPRSYVKFAHMRFSARHQQEGDVQGWHWSNEGSGYYRYALLLNPDGTATYHDFDELDEEGRSLPLDTFRCSRIS